MKFRRAVSFAAIICAGPLFAQESDNTPLSAIDWLSESVETPAAAPIALGEPVPGTSATRTPSPDEDPVTESATIPDVSVRPLDAPSPDLVGLLPADVTGLSVSLWSASEEEVLVNLLRAESVDTLPAIQHLLTMLVLAEAEPPLNASPQGALFLARVDKLLDMGALEPAQALLEAAAPETPQLFRRWFDVSLLTGTEDAACDMMQSRPAIAPTPSARIFCLARSGDWSAAALTLNTARVLGDINEETAELMSRFLDPDLFEGEPPLARPSRPSPLVFRMREAIGEGLNTSSLPRAFAHADLRSTTGWKAQIDAAERLARTQAISTNVLLDVYTARVPAASGGVWERAKAVQALEAAFHDGDPEAIDAALETAWVRMGEVGLRPALAEIYAPRLAELPAQTPLSFRVMMLTDMYESIAIDADPALAETLLAAVAVGSVEPEMRVSRLEASIRDGFADVAPDAALVDMAAQGRLGEAILRNIAGFEQGLAGDPHALSESLATFRALGLEDTARRAALQYLVLKAS